MMIFLIKKNENNEDQIVVFDLDSRNDEILNLDILEHCLEGIGDLNGIDGLNEF